MDDTVTSVACVGGRPPCDSVVGAMRGLSKRFGFGSRAGLVAVFAALALTLPTSASAYLYWSDGKGIARANLDGRGVNTGFISDVHASEGVLVSGPYIYCGDEEGIVLRARVDGGDIDPDLFTILQQPMPLPSGIDEEGVAGALAVAGAHVYWSLGGDDDAIGRAGIDGGEAEPRFIETGEHDGEIAVGGGYLYWTTEDAIGRARLDGTEVEPSFIRLHGPEASRAINGIAVADGRIYWSAWRSHSIGRANLDGHGLDESFITSPDYPLNLAVAGRYIYWQSENSYFDTAEIRIGRANIDGGDVENELINITGELTGERYGGFTADTLGPGGERPPTHAKRKPKHGKPKHAEPTR
jgi:hypothetical protein